MFITFEGIDGAGKSTVIKKLKLFCKNNKIDCVFTKEPGFENLHVSSQISQILLNSKYKISPMTEAILFLADRQMHLEEVILPALKSKKIVFCERYVDSSLAYQGFAREIGIEKIWNLNKNIIDKIMPNITFYFDINYKKTFKRLNKKANKDRIENEDINFQKKVYQGYKKIMESSKYFPNRFISINANSSENIVFEEIKNNLIKILKL